MVVKSVWVPLTNPQKVHRKFAHLHSHLNEAKHRHLKLYQHLKAHRQLKPYRHWALQSHLTPCPLGARDRQLWWSVFRFFFFRIFLPFLFISRTQAHKNWQKCKFIIKGSWFETSTWPNINEIGKKYTKFLPTPGLKLNKSQL